MTILCGKRKILSQGTATDTYAPPTKRKRYYDQEKNKFKLQAVADIKNIRQHATNNDDKRSTRRQIIWNKWQLTPSDGKMYRNKYQNLRNWELNEKKMIEGSMRPKGMHFLKNQPANNLARRTFKPHEEELIADNVDMMTRQYNNPVSKSDIQAWRFDLAALLNIKHFKGSHKAYIYYLRRWKQSRQKINIRSAAKNISNYKQLNDRLTLEIIIAQKTLNIEPDRTFNTDQTRLEMSTYPKDTIASHGEGKTMNATNYHANTRATGILTMNGLGQQCYPGICFKETDGILGRRVELNIKTHPITKIIFVQASTSCLQVRTRVVNPPYL